MPVFVSHSSKDGSVARDAVVALEEDGLQCWVAPRDIPPGASYAEAIVSGLQRSRAALVVVSRHSAQSPQVAREIERAVHYGLPLLPFKIDDSPLEGTFEYFLSLAHWMDASQPPIAKHLQRLPGAIRDLIGEPLSAGGSTPADVQPPRTPLAEEISPDTWSRKPRGRLRRLLGDFLEDPQS